MREPYKWRNFSRSIKIVPKNKKDKKKAKLLIDILNYKINQIQTCMWHKLDYALLPSIYRLYRRGNNRCLNCGVKINNDTSHIGRK